MSTCTKSARTNLLVSLTLDSHFDQLVITASIVPQEALAMIRYHSFYPWHREGAYQHLMNEKDYDQLKAVKAFNRELTLLHILETSFNIDCLLSL